MWILHADMQLVGLDYLVILNSPIGENVSVNGCLSLCVSHVSEWQPDQVVPRFSLYGIPPHNRDKQKRLDE